ncbi:MAG: YchJ family protein [Methylovulum sp.]|nr:YchJ family protein [Methylovulum sp.]
MTLPIPCPCGSNLSYTQCCARFHNGDNIPATAEALMRSRFAAFALQKSAYLLATWDDATRPAHLDFTNDTTQWLRLEIVSTKKGGANDNKGIVSFNAYFRQQSEDGVLSETSRFSKIGDRWFYVDGDVKLANAKAVQSKNGLCACGSGKKFKHCCMK